MLFTLGFAILFVALWALFYVIGPTLERLLAHLARSTASLRYKDYLPVFAVLAAGAVITAVLGDQFLSLAELVQENSAELESADAKAHAWAAATRTHGATLFFTIMTIIGTPAGLAIISFALSAVLVVQKHWRWAVYLMATGTIGGLLNLQLKSYFARARPDLAEALREAHGYSFPSGHAMGSMVVFGAIAYVLFRWLTNWRARSAAVALCTSFIGAIAFSRIYLGVHWISDVAAGLAAGLVWLTTATLAYEIFRRIRRVRSMRQPRRGGVGVTS